MPERIQRQRTKGWRKPEGAIYVGRPTIWGNPWRVPIILEGPPTYRRPPLHALAPFEYQWGRVDVSITPWLAVALYDTWIHAEGRAAVVREHLRGHDLVCWCPLTVFDPWADRMVGGVPCHADILLEVANA